MNVKLAAILFAVLSLTVGLPDGTSPSSDSPGDSGPVRMVEGLEFDRVIFPAPRSTNFVAEPEDLSKVQFVAEPEDLDSVCFILVGDGPIEVCEQRVTGTPKPVFVYETVP